MRKKLHLEFGGYSDAGVKATNEDAFTALLPTERSVRKYKGGAACIADGVSCSDNAQVASQTAVTNFISDYFSTPDFWTVEQSASKVIGSINSWLFEQNRHNQGNTRADSFVTTFSSLVVKSHTAHIMHCGDSRIYLIRDGEMECLTTDHCYRKGGENYLTRALGIENRLDLDYRSLKVHLGDRFLLTTDGVHEALPNKKLLELACKPNIDIETLAKEIGDASLKAGSDDNISCLLIDVTELPIERIDEVFKDLTELTIPPVLESGNKIDNFEIIRLLHSGTRSHVYLARDTINDERFVLKMPSINFAEDIAYLESFAREQWIGRKLSHPQLMKVHTPTRGTNFLYHVCEFVEGITLRQWMTDNPTPDLNQVRNILDSLIPAVRVLHRNKMVHRDLKPENFMIDRDGKITLIDFGTLQVPGSQEASELKLDSLPVGDVSYIAPEYLVYGIANNQSDLFSIATIVYEMITAKLPYNAVKSNRDYPSKFDKWNYRSISTRSTQSINMPYWLDAVLKKALSPNPNNRYKALSEFQSELRSPGNDSLKPKEFIPLIERNPLHFWQICCFVLFIVIIIQWGLLAK